MAERKYQSWPIAKLEREVRRHNRLYFVDGAPEISDRAFDRMVNVLRARAPESAALSEIGSDLAGARTEVCHAVPMLSLDKCTTVDALTAWAEKYSGSFVASPKIDGVAMALRYDAKGKLVVAATRGNGLVGEDVTANVHHVSNVPSHVKAADIEIRGELYMPLSVFREHFAEAFASPRNLSAGALKQKDAHKTADFHVVFFAYDLLGTDAATEVAKRAQLVKLGFDVAPWTMIMATDFASHTSAMLAGRDQLDFETDGIVVRVNHVAEQERVGSTAHHPRYAIAYKYPGDSATTTLESIAWSVSRSSVITPVGIITPVALSGAMVRRVSLHNYGLAKQQRVGCGATVVVMRRGGVIPHLETVIKPGRRVLRAPKTCPSCGSATAIDGDFVYCSNASGCGKTLVGALKYFLDAIDCEGFGPKLLQQLVDAHLVADPADLFALTAHDLRTLERMGDVSAEKLIRHLAARRSLPLDVFLRALGIPELARQTSRILAGFGSLARVLQVTEEDLAQLHGIGPQVASLVIAGLASHKALIAKLQTCVTIHAVERPSGGPLDGKRVLFTGTLEAMDRRVAQTRVEALGGHVASGVSKTLDYLVVGGAGTPGSKLTKAKKLVEGGAALAILTEAEFLELVNV